jgi:hypothetical protein
MNDSRVVISNFDKEKAAHEERLLDKTVSK